MGKVSWVQLVDGLGHWASGTGPAQIGWVDWFVWLGIGWLGGLGYGLA